MRVLNQIKQYKAQSVSAGRFAIFLPVPELRKTFAFGLESLYTPGAYSSSTFVEARQNHKFKKSYKTFYVIMVAVIIYVTYWLTYSK